MEGKEAIKMPTRSWHFFDIPRVLDLGSYSFYLEIESLLSKYDIQGRLDVSFVFADDEKMLMEGVGIGWHLQMMKRLRIFMSWRGQRGIRSIYTVIELVNLDMDTFIICKFTR